jgi:glycosyltransferase involved in cell wall biosynthesis
LLVGSQPNAVDAVSCTEPGCPESLRRLEVCHMASADRWAGAEVQLAALLKALQRISDLRVSAIFLNEGRLADEARQSGIEVCVVPETKHNFFQILSKARSFLQTRNVQILHSHRYKENLLAALLACRCRVPVHVTSRHGAPEPFAGSRRYKQGLIEGLDRWVARYSTDCVVSVSEDLRRQLIHYLPASKVITIHNGIDAERVFSPFSAAEAKQRLGIPPDSWVVGTAGRLDPIKRLDVFLAAAREIIHAQPNARFVIAGEGQEEQRLRELAHGLRLDGRILFLGHRDDIYDVLRAMDIFVLCSDHEGLPMALLEALCLGVTVVARPVGGVAEVIEGGVNGILVASSDPSALATQCLGILTDEDRRKRMVQAASRLIADKFGVKQTAAEVAKLYRSLSQAR